MHLKHVDLHDRANRRCTSQQKINKKKIKIKKKLNVLTRIWITHTIEHTHSPDNFFSSSLIQCGTQHTFWIELSALSVS